MEELNTKLEEDKLEIEVVDAGMDSEMETYGVCCIGTFMPIRIWP